MESAHDRLRRARIERGFTTAAEAARAFGWNENTYASNENGNATFSRKLGKRYADALGVRVEWLMDGVPPMRGNGPTSVRLVGYVGAGAAAHFYNTADEGLGEVDPPWDLTENTVAAEIRGESLGPLFSSWLVFYDDVRSPVTADLIGKLCVVGLPDDRVLVKLLKASATEGLYHLLSNTEPPILDEEVTWAARVKHMSPR